MITNNYQKTTYPVNYFTKTVKIVHFPVIVQNKIGVGRKVFAPTEALLTSQKWTLYT